MSTTQTQAVNDPVPVSLPASLGCWYDPIADSIDPNLPPDEIHESWSHAIRQPARWTAIGTVRERFHPILQHLDQLLSMRRDDLNRGLKMIVPHHVDCYVVGPKRSRETAEPCLGISHRSHRFCRRAKNEISTDAKWREFCETTPLRIRIFRNDPVARQLMDKRQALGNTTMEFTATDPTVFVTKKTPLHGATLLIFSRYLQKSRHARLGGIVWLDNRPHALTVAHCFKNDATDASEDSDSMSTSDSSLEENCISDNDNLDHVAGEQRFVNTSSNDGDFSEKHFHLPVPALTIEHNNAIATVQASDQFQDPEEEDWVRLGSVTFSSAGSLEDAVDWALIAIETPDLLESFTLSQFHISNTLEWTTRGSHAASIVSKRVRMIRPYANVSGYMSAYPRLIGYSGASRMIQATEARFPGVKLELGDCGAWIVDDTNMLLGHIIGGIPGSPIAYMSLIHDIQRSVQLTTGATFNLGRQEPNRNLQEDAVPSTRSHSVMDNLRNCCFVMVEGFFEKYFESKTWVSTSDEIATAVRLDSDLSRPFTQKRGMWDWISQFQKKHLGRREVRGLYSSITSRSEQSGAMTGLQPELFLRIRKRLSADRFLWEDVRVIGEHHKSSDNSTGFLNLARCAKEVFAAQPMRLFVHGFLLIGDHMELHVFDRAGAFSATAFNFMVEPGRFLRVLTGYVLMSDQELGMDTFMERREQTNLLTLLDDELNLQQFEIEEKPITRSPAIVCRATCCYRTIDGRSLVKFAWQLPKIVSEAEYIRAANGIKGLVQLVASGEITTIEKLRTDLAFTRRRQFHRNLDRTGLFFSQSVTVLQSDAESSHEGKKNPSASEERPRKKSRFNGQPLEFSQEYQASQDAGLSTSGFFEELGGLTENTLRRLTLTWLVVSPAGRPLSSFSNVPELLRALRDAIKTHQSLFEANILHRAISINSIIITNPEEADGYFGMLIDMDTATRIGAHGINEDNATSHKTDNMEFMAIGVLRSAADRNIQHTYRHDLESFFYVFLFICVNHGWPSGQEPTEHPLQSWCTPPYESIIATKTGHMARDNFEEMILKKFPPDFECIKSLGRNLRDTLFHKGELYTSTPLDHHSLYEGVINAFEAAIDLLAGST